MRHDAGGGPRDRRSSAGVSLPLSADLAIQSRLRTSRAFAEHYHWWRRGRVGMAATGEGYWASFGCRVRRVGADSGQFDAHAGRHDRHARARPPETGWPAERRMAGHRGLRAGDGGDERLPVFGHRPHSDGRGRHLGIPRALRGRPGRFASLARGPVRGGRAGRRGPDLVHAGRLFHRPATCSRRARTCASACTRSSPTGSARRAPGSTGSPCRSRSRRWTLRRYPSVTPRMRRPPSGASSPPRRCWESRFPTRWTRCPGVSRRRAWSARLFSIDPAMSVVIAALILRQTITVMAVVGIIVVSFAGALLVWSSGGDAVNG